MAKRKKRVPTYKQMAFDTAVRNPERYIDILTVVRDFDGEILDDDILLNIVSALYLEGVVTSSEININENTTIRDIKDLVMQVNSSRNADGGFPKGYQSRFWTYMRALCELGFVFARYNQEFRLSKTAKMLIDRDIDEQEAFSIQAMKYNRKSPYRNVSNDFNFFKFILMVLLKLKETNKSLSYEQFIIATFSNDGNVENFLEIIENNKFKDYDTTFEFIKENYSLTTNYQTTMQDYPDVVRRFFIISGFITIKYSGKKLIQINENKLDYIKEICNIDFNLTDDEKNNENLFFQKFESYTDIFLDLLYKYREQDKIIGDIYTKQLYSIIKDYNITEDIIIKSIEKIGSKTTEIQEFKEIPEPLKLEFFISILIALKYKSQFIIRPNYKADHIGKPYSHAPGNTGDIEVFSKTIYWLIEVTLIRNKTQQLNHETTSVIRHLFSNDEFANRFIKYLSFIAPQVHQDTQEFFDYQIVKSKNDTHDIYIKPYSIREFIDIISNFNILDDMNKYTQKVIEDFRNKLT
ncbi:AlwI family type II restriction endonuclease [Arcobacter sp.]|uniref:AlwI family type II restriction endonuclease n=1 Tax=Arcobacter sp. TaxID=1872629 RepID=UPI003D0E8066